jgi:hypothetical protein
VDLSTLFSSSSTLWLAGLIAYLVGALREVPKGLMGLIDQRATYKITATTQHEAAYKAL